MISSVNSSIGSTNQIKSDKKQLQAEDFIKLLVTQLQNQDPTEPAKNSELLAQMSQIGQLQSSTTLTKTLEALTLQNQLGASAGLIGKTVKGLDAANEDVTGVVGSVRVEGNDVFLELDNGQSLSLSRVTHVASAPAAQTTFVPE